MATLITILHDLPLSFLFSEALSEDEYLIRDKLGTIPEDLILAEVRGMKEAKPILQHLRRFPFKRIRLFILNRTSEVLAYPPDLLPYITGVVDLDDPPDILARITTHLLALRLEKEYEEYTRQAILSGRSLSAVEHAAYLSEQFEKALGLKTMIAIDFGDGPAAHHPERSWDDYKKYFPKSVAIHSGNVPKNFLYVNGIKARKPKMARIRWGEYSIAIPLIDSFRLVLNVAIDEPQKEFRPILLLYASYMPEILAPVLEKIITGTIYHQVSYDLGRLEQFATDASFFQTRLDDFRRNPNAQQLGFYNNVLDQRSEFAMKLFDEGPKGMHIKTPLTKRQGLNIPKLWERLGTDVNLKYSQSGPELSGHGIYAGISLEILRLFAALATEEGICKLRVVNADTPKHIVTTFIAPKLELGQAESRQLLDGLSLRDIHSRLFEARTIVRLWGGELEIHTESPDPGVTLVLTAPVIIFNYGPDAWRTIQ